MYSQSIATTYNKTLTVFQADSELAQIGKDWAVQKLLDIIVKFGVSAIVGLRLIHRHNDIIDTEAMIEEAIIDAEGYSLVTKPRLLLEHCSGVVPNSWVLTDDGFIAMEFSQPNLLSNSDFSPKNQPDFFKELAAAIKEHSLSSVLGPALRPSEEVNINSQGATQMIELSNLDDRSNVLRFIKFDDLRAGTTIETFWCATGENNQTSEQTPDTARPQRVCTRICPSVQNPPVHQGTYIHRSSDQ